MKLMAPFGKTKMESHGMAFGTSGAKGYLEKSWRWFRGKNQMGSKQIEEVTREVLFK